ncbi:MAG: mechanosensitive ion channel family protein [Candidatus Nanohaloarchaea archaeon]
MVLENLVPDIALYLRVLRFFIVLAAGAVVTRILVMPAVSWLAARRTDDKVSIHSLSNLAGVTAFFLSFIVALQAAEFGGLVTVLGAITAALTVAVGFGMRDQISNLVGGFFIHTDTPFVKGDYIRVGESEGVVKEISLRQTVLNGPSSEKLVLPNSAVTLNPVRNFTKGRRTKIPVSLRIGASDKEKFEELALKAAEENREVLEQPEPAVYFSELEGQELQMELRCWTRDSSDARRLKSDLLDDLLSGAEKQGLFGKED